MTKKEYAEAVIKAGNFEGRVVEVQKDNTGILTGCAIRTSKNKNMGFTFYIDNDYTAGTSVEDCANQIKKIYDKQIESGEDEIMDKLTQKVKDFDAIKDDIYIKILNRKLNENNETQVSRVCPFADGLIEVLWLDLNEDYSVRINSDMIKMWKKTEDEMFDIALKNLKKQEYVFETLEEHISAMVGKKVDGESPLYVVTNKENHKGANMVLVAMDDIKTMFPEGFYLIPNSIHEFMVCSKNAMPKELLQEMLHIVNRDLPTSEFLSDTIYEF